MTTFITRLDSSPSGPLDSGGPRLAVKDLIDLEGVPTTAGSRAVADDAKPAAADAACMAGARAAAARIVGKANLYELAFGTSGVNRWFGTPVNPFDPALVPGGSSSGSAVAVATDEADVAYGSDTGGSIRVPAAFCGVTGLKTTFGRIPVEGVWPLAASLDTVGPMARDVAGVVLGMQLLEPGFRVDAGPAVTVGRARLPMVDTDPAVDTAIDAALREAELDVVDVAIPEWADAGRAVVAILVSEAYASNRRLLDDPVSSAKLSAEVADRLRSALVLTAEEVSAARAVQRDWQARLDSLFAQVQVLALPTVPFFPPPIEGAQAWPYTALTNPANLAGVPALSQPVPAGAIPAGLQLYGPARGEALLLATAARVEAATRRTL